MCVLQTKSVPVRIIIVSPLSACSGGLYERILEERVSFNMPHAVSRLHSVLELGQHSPGAVRAVKIAMTRRRPMANNALMQVSRIHLRRHRMFDDFCINGLHFLVVCTGETLT